LSNILVYKPIILAFLFFSQKDFGSHKNIYISRDHLSKLVIIVTDLTINGSKEV